MGSLMKPKLEVEGSELHSSSLPRYWFLFPLALVVLSYLLSRERPKLDAVTASAALAFNILKVMLGYLIIILFGYCLWPSARRPVRGGFKLFAQGDTVLTSFMIGTLVLMFVTFGLGVLGSFTWSATVLTITTVFLFRYDKLRKLAQTFRISAKTGEHKHSHGWDFFWVIILLGTGPLLVSLNSPMPSWMDIVEINIGPVERLLSFSSFSLDTYLPFSVYPNNRAVPLFTSFFAVIAQIFQLRAFETIGASLFPQLILTLFAVYCLGFRLKGHLAGILATFGWVLGFGYVHLQDARSTLWHFPFSILALIRYLELEKWVLAPKSTRRDNTLKLKMLELGLASGVAFLSHPFEGLFTLCLLSLLLLRIALLGGLQKPLIFIFCFSHVFIAQWILLFWGLGKGWGWLVLSGFCALWAVKMSWSWPLHPTAGFANTWFNARKADFFLFFVSILAMVAPWKWHYLDVFPIGRAFFRYPILILLLGCLGFYAVQVLVRKRPLSQGLICWRIVAGIWVTISVPLWILPYLPLSLVSSHSMAYEFPLKGMDFWASGLFAALGGAGVGAMLGKVLSALKKVPEQYFQKYLKVGPIILFMTFIPFICPVGPKIVGLWGQTMESECDQAGLYDMLLRHFKLGREGYWKGYEDDRSLVGKSSRQLNEFLISLRDSKEINFNSRVTHLASSYYLWEATPFPAFTGVIQDLCTKSVHPMDIHAYGGRIKKIGVDCFNSSFGPEWILLEKSYLGSAALADRNLVDQWVKSVNGRLRFSNDRFLLYQAFPKKNTEQAEI